MHRASVRGRAGRLTKEGWIVLLADREAHANAIARMRGTDFAL
jgi:RecG-like helicase